MPPKRGRSGTARKTRKGQQSLRNYFQSSSPPSVAAEVVEEDEPTRELQVGASRKSTSQVSGRKPRVIAQGDDSTSSSSNHVGDIDFEPVVVSVSDSDDETKESPRRPAKKRRLLRSARESDLGSEASEQEKDISIKRKGKAKEVNKKQLILDSEEDEPPRKRKLVKGVRPPTPEPENLLEEIDEDTIIESRFRARNKKSDYLKNLERLKKRKRGERLPSDEEEDDSDVSEPFRHARPDEGPESERREGDVFSDDDQEDTFIVEDEGEAVELPVEFSMNTYQDLKHHFKIICQLFVHIVVRDYRQRKSFVQQSMQDQYFSVPLQIARRKLSGMRDSLVASSVWRADFKKPLERYPEFELIQLEFSEPGCDACHLGGRLSTLIGRLSGSPYDKQTYESSDDTIDSDSDSGLNDVGGDREHPKKEFRLGRFCGKRTRVFHQFTHWEYALFKALENEVNGLRQRESRQARRGRTFVPVAYAGGAQPPDDLTDADAIMNWLDQRHIIEFQWHAVKSMMDEARNLEVASKRGDDDD
ncbi:hypothetical protein K474DRAFT_1673008 [Panus rudis PR-1116 ss-1]|nr:hypothetical protein K474DRAFT_1673008 [Panus rudis PR-1116 ss-1]